MSAAAGGAEGRYAALAEELATSSGVTSSKMFGMPTLKAGGKAFAGFYEGSMVFKLDGDAHRRALGLPGARVFDPSGMGRPMKAWVVVPGEHGEAWAGFAREALASLRGG